MTVNQSFTGSIANPIVQARTEVAMSANQLAKRLGLSRQYLSRAEQGTYTSLNPSLLKWTSQTLGWSPQSTERRYQNFQAAQRRATVEKVNPHKLERHTGNQSPGAVIFERWRSSYWISTTSFAAAFCIHPDLVTKYEEGITKTMPKVLREILIDAKLLDSQVDLDAILAPKG